ncbi:MAG: sensor histidine kinase [Sedimenticola sp.]|nr:MAG: sensor histidine kinase [Sedimenticola sp.]
MTQSRDQSREEKDKVRPPKPTAARESTASASFLPNFCSIRMVFAVVITAELLAIVLTLAAGTTLRNFSADLSLRSMMVQWISLIGAALLCLLRTLLGRLSNTLAGIIAWLLLMLVTLLVVLAAHYFVEVHQDAEAFRGFLLRSLGISAILSAMVLRYLHVQHLWRQQVHAESQARFQALQSRIRPHFLFNSMNTIANLARANPQLAEEVVYDLSDLFRATLSSAQRKSTLGDELELCRGYLRIETQRLGERLRVEWDLQGLPEQAPLPPLILQPLVENAVYHGIEPSSEPGVICVSGRYRRGKVNLSIRNTLPRQATEQHREGNSMAMENTRQRLQGYFSGEATLTVGKVDGDHQVRVVFPYPWKP